MSQNIIHKLLLQFAKQNFFSFAIVLITSVGMNLLQVIAVAFVIAKIIESIQKRNFVNLGTYYYYFIGVSITFMILVYLYKFVQNRLSNNFRHWFRLQMVKFILQNNDNNLSNVNFMTYNTPISRISSTHFYMLTSLLSSFIPNLTLLLVIFVYFMTKDYYLGGTFLVGNVIIMIMLYLSFPSMFTFNQQYEKEVTRSEGSVIEILSNIDKIITMGQSKNEVNHLKDDIAQTINTSIRFFHETNVNTGYMSSVAYITIFGCMALLFWKYKQNNITKLMCVDLLTIILIYRDKILSIISDIPEYLEFYGRSKHSVGLFNKMLAVKDTIYSEKALPFNEIKFVNVSFRYPDTSRIILQNFTHIIDLSKKNSIIGIKGSSGNGKSTIAKLIIKLYNNYEGDILIDNVNVKEIDNEYLRKHITYVNQNLRLFDRRLIDNVFYGCQDQELCEKKYQEIISSSKIQSLFKNKNFEEYRAGQNGEKLSGGQRQVINIINGLINSSEIVILDEPTNALDPELKIEIIKIIKQFKKQKKAIIIITHDPILNEVFDQVVNV